jgi:glyoxylase-like metal-dependent hydrolase (beta-lactamase superfamily II)
MKVSGYQVGYLSTNCYLISNETTKEALIVDPGGAGDALAEEIRKQGLSLKGILLTHAHFDHIAGVAALLEKIPAPLYAGENEKRLCSMPEYNNSKDYGRPTTVKPDVWARDGEKFSLADLDFTCIATPGHTEGSVCWYFPKETTGDQPVLFAGDTVFEESVGRTDMPTGSMSDLVHSVKDKLFALPDETLVLPGHGGSTTIGHEKQYNCFV